MKILLICVCLYMAVAQYPKMRSGVIALYQDITGKK